MPTRSAYSWLVLLGTLLPVWGVVATVVLAWISRGRLRWLALALVPALVLAVCWQVAPVVWRDGNLLAAALFMAYYAALCLYYPLLLVIGGVALARRSRPAPEPSASPGRHGG